MIVIKRWRWCILAYVLAARCWVFRYIVRLFVTVMETAYCLLRSTQLLILIALGTEL